MLYTILQMVDRVKLVNVRMSESELTMLRELAESLGLSQSDIIRQLIRRAHTENELGKPKHKRPKK